MPKHRHTKDNQINNIRPTRLATISKLDITASMYQRRTPEFPR